MSRRTRLIILVSALALLEATAYWKLASWLNWTSEPPLAFASALAFLALLVASIVSLSAQLPDQLVPKVQRVGAVLILFQSLANTLISYMYARTVMPVDVVVAFFNVRPDIALKAVAVVQGATLSLVSLTVWSVVGILLRQEVEEGEQRLEKEEHRLVELGNILKEHAR